MSRKHPLSRPLALVLTISLLALAVSSGACGESILHTQPSPGWSALSLFPKTGPSHVATNVWITGTAFRTDSIVLVDGIAAEITSRDANFISAVFPAHAPGVVNVSVTRNANQQVSASHSTTFEYYDLAATPLLSFTDPVTGLSTSEIHDAQEEIVRFNVAHDLLWSDGTRFPGFVFDGVNIQAQRLCSCWIQVRFGSRNGNRRAYLTATYPHEGNPGTVLDLERSGSGISSHITHVPVSEPGPNTFSGVITEATAGGPVPLPDAGVFFFLRDGWRAANTNKDGRFEVPWLDDVAIDVVFGKPGYQSVTRQVSIVGNTRVDVQLGR